MEKGKGRRVSPFGRNVNKNRELFLGEGTAAELASFSRGKIQKRVNIFVPGFFAWQPCLSVRSWDGKGGCVMGCCMHIRCIKTRETGVCRDKKNRSITVPLALPLSAANGQKGRKEPLFIESDTSLFFYGISSSSPDYHRGDWEGKGKAATLVILPRSDSTVFAHSN